MYRQPFLVFALCFCLLSNHLRVSNSEKPSIYEILRSHGLPMGLLPKGVQTFSFDDDGNLLAHLDQACNTKVENELHYERNISGTLRYGQIFGLSGMSAQDLFLWFDVKEIRVDVPSSGVIYFDVGVVSKQFSLSSFETPQECKAAQASDRPDGMIIADVVSKSRLGDGYHQIHKEEQVRAVS